MSRVSAVRIATAIFWATALVPGSVASEELAANSPPLKCDIGPVIKKFGANGYQLFGEGAGRNNTTAAAFDELKALSERDIATLIEQTERR